MRLAKADCHRLSRVLLDHPALISQAYRAWPYGSKLFGPRQRRLFAQGHGRSSSVEDLPNHLAVVDGEPLAAGDLELAGIEAHLMQDRGMDVGHVVRIFDGVEAQFIGCAVRDSPFDPAAGKPGTESLRVMVASRLLGARGAAELGAKDDERRVEQAATFQIFEQAADGAIDLRCQAVITFFDIGVGIPFPSPARPVVELHKADATFNEPAGCKAALAKFACLRAVETIELMCFGSLCSQVDRIGNGALHAEG